MPSRPRKDPSQPALPGAQGPEEAGPRPGSPEPQPAQGIRWEMGIEGLAFCWLACAFLFPISPFFGLSLLGVGTLMVGIAFGRD